MFCHLLLLKLVERRVQRINVIAQGAGLFGDDAASLNAGVALVERSGTGGKQLSVRQYGAGAVDVGRQGVEALQRVDVAAHGGKQHGWCRWTESGGTRRFARRKLR